MLGDRDLLEAERGDRLEQHRDPSHDRRRTIRMQSGQRSALGERHRSRTLEQLLELRLGRSMYPRRQRGRTAP